MKGLSFFGAKAFLFSLLAFFLAMPQAYACTAWGLVGTNGTYVVKVRDERPAAQTVKKVSDGRGYAFVGLFVGKAFSFNTGVNEKGLFVGRLTAGSVPKAVRVAQKDIKSPEGFSSHEYLIRTCASVKEALEKKEVFSSRHPAHYLLADAREVVFVECAPDGRFAVVRNKTCVLTHTNHYTAPMLLAMNEKIGESSLTRYQRIGALSKRFSKDVTWEEFLRPSHDQSEGLDNSIFRLGSKVGGTRTLAIVAAKITPGKTPELICSYLANPKEDTHRWEKVRVSPSP